MSYQYFSHVQEHGAQPHLADFFYQSAGPESLGEYLLRNLQNFFNLFSPWPASDLSVFLAILAALLAVAAFTLWRLLRHSEPGKRAALATMAAAGVMLIELMLAGALGKYPFGGFMRHQFLLFPFLVLCAFLLPDRLAGAIPVRARYALAALLFVTVLGVSYSRFEAYPKVKEALMTDQMRRYNNLFPEAAAVYTDQYNFIAFFLHHDDWEWKFVERISSEANVANIDIYRIRRGGRQMLVFDDNGLWVADPLDAGVYYSMAACIRAEALPSITLFRSAQDDETARDKAGLKAYRKQIADTARDQGLCVESLDLYGSDVYAEVRAGNCDPESPAAAGR
jgi:hypothetical protein